MSSNFGTNLRILIVFYVVSEKILENFYAGRQTVVGKNPRRGSFNPRELFA